MKIIKINQSRFTVKKIKNPLNKMERESISYLCREGRKKNKKEKENKN
jgi:hypothetical protein